MAGRIHVSPVGLRAPRGPLAGAGRFWPCPQRPRPATALL